MNCSLSNWIRKFYCTNSYKYTTIKIPNFHIIDNQSINY